MKKPLFFLLFFALIVVSCVDEQYDLSKIESDNIAIGSDESEFRMPLTRLSIHVEQLTAESEEGEVTILETYNEADIWLPTELPGGVDYVEVVRLSEDEAYLRSILDALFAEMRSSESKRTEVCTLIATSYREEFISLLAAHIPQTVLDPILTADTAEAAEQIASLFLNNEWQEQVIEGITEIAESHICDMQIDDVLYEIPDLGLSADVETMILDNLDPIEVEPADNALYLYGAIDCELPFQVQLQPYFEGTNVAFGTLHVGHDYTPIDEVRISSDDMQTILSGTRLHMPVLIERYYPHIGINPDQVIQLNTSLRKTGSLQL